jgi:hypothetical protein
MARTIAAGAERRGSIAFSQNLYAANPGAPTLTSMFIDDATELIRRTWLHDRTVITLGNGGSALTALRYISELAKPRLEELATWLDQQLQRIPVSSELAKAIRYARSRWVALTRYVEDGRLEISNNAVENMLRCIGIGCRTSGTAVGVLASCSLKMPMILFAEP